MAGENVDCCVTNSTSIGYLSDQIVGIQDNLEVNLNNGLNNLQSNINGVQNYLIKKQVVTQEQLGGEELRFTAENVENWQNTIFALRAPSGPLPGPSTILLGNVEPGYQAIVVNNTGGDITLVLDSSIGLDQLIGPGAAPQLLTDGNTAVLYSLSDNTVLGAPNVWVRLQ